VNKYVSKYMNMKQVRPYCNKKNFFSVEQKIQLWLFVYARWKKCCQVCA